MDDTMRGRHTYTEILSQPETWKQTLQSLPAFPLHALDISSYEQLLFTGCGSTYYLSQWAARQCQQEGIAATALPASELMLYSGAWLRSGARTLLVAVSRSGETSETLRAVESFRRSGHEDVLAVTCYPQAALPQLASWTILTPSAREESVAQTRSFTSMMLAVAGLINRKTESIDEQRLFCAAGALIEKYEGLAKTVVDNSALTRFFFLGSGPYYGLACEAMLKMKEVSLSYAEAYHVLEFRHGPMSMVGNDSLVIGLLGGNQMDRQLAVLRDMQALGALTAAVVERDTPEISKVADYVIALNSDLSPIWRAPLYLPVLQLMAYYRAIAKGLDPDHPVQLKAVVKLDE